VPEVSFAAAKACGPATIPSAGCAAGDPRKGKQDLIQLLLQQKRDGLRMMHTPRTTLLFAAEQGIGFVHCLAGRRRRFHAGDPRQFGSPGRASAALLLGPTGSRTIEALRDALSDKDARFGRAVHSISLRNQPALKKELEPLLQTPKSPCACARPRVTCDCRRLRMGRTKERSTAALAPGAQKRKK